LTASGLLFVGRNDGRLTALDSSNGKKLWQFQTGSGMNSPAVTFEYQGKQYVLAYAGGNTLAPSPHGDNVWLFSLDGTMPETEAPGKTGTAATAEVKVADGNPDVAAGELVYRSACVACHGADGRGGHGGGIDLANARDYKMVVNTVAQGRRNMPALGAAFTPEQLRDVAGFVSQKIARPAPAQ
jgi:alcohol dehydrogenase (cytochrome c)